jgi:hypothetical protein
VKLEREADLSPVELGNSDHPTRASDDVSPWPARDRPRLRGALDPSRTMPRNVNETQIDAPLLEEVEIAFRWRQAGDVAQA